LDNAVISGGELISRCLAAQGIRFVFSVDSERLSPILDSFEGLGSSRVIKARNETAATVMADGYIRRGRRLAAVLTDDNGSALSQISGVTNAWADKIPLLSLSLCAEGEPDYGKGFDRFRFDQGEVFQAVTQYRRKVTSLEELPGALADVINYSLSDKMGPVHLDIPFGLLDQPVESSLGPSEDEARTAEERRVEPVRIAADDEAIERAAAIVRGAERPLIFAGGGVHASDAHEELRELAEKFGIPVATSMAGIGSFPTDHDLSLGPPSYTGGETFHVAIKEADVVIAVGVSFSGLEGFGLPPLWSDAIKFVQIDIAPLQFGLNVKPDVPVLGDARTALRQLIDEAGRNGFKGKAEWGEWSAHLAKLKRDRAKRLAKLANRRWPKGHQGRFAQELGRFVKRDDLLMVIDGGNTPLYAAMYAPAVGPRQAFFPFGMSALGGGIPYAIGVQLASPDKRVMLATGDGSFMYNVQELETIKRLDLPILIAVNNDSAWNMIKAMQDMLYARNFVGTCLPDVDYAKIAEGFGLYAERVMDSDEIAPAYERAVASGGPALIDAITDSSNVPDSLLSFTLVEFEGALTGIHPLKLARSLWMMRDTGIHRMMHMSTYIRKAILRINPLAKLGGSR
jgi:acetolactate synthase-1/2/3 large subunit